MNNRLTEWVNENWKCRIISEAQADFRKGYLTVGNLFSLENIVRLKWDEQFNKVYCFFVDFRTAFDRVNREILYSLNWVG